MRARAVIVAGRSIVRDLEIDRIIHRREVPRVYANAIDGAARRILYWGADSIPQNSGIHVASGAAGNNQNSVTERIGDIITVPYGAIANLDV